MITLEYTGDTGPVQRNFDALARLALDAGGVSASVRFGTGTITWPGGSPRANTLNVDHGLGGTPIVVLATPTSSLGGGVIFPVVATFAYGATQFSASSVTSDGSSPAAATTHTFVWLAIG